MPMTPEQATAEADDQDDEQPTPNPVERLKAVKQVSEKYIF